MSKKIIYLIVLGLLILGLAFAFIVLREANRGPFILDGENYDSVEKCSPWRYENIDFIPCQNSTGDYSGILPDQIDSSLSPEDNCLRYGSDIHFPGFNVKNSTRNDIIIESILPVCTEISKNNLTQELLNNFTCIKESCPFGYFNNGINCTKYFSKDSESITKNLTCKEYQDGNAIIIP